MSKNPFDIQSLAPTWATADLAKSAVLKGDVAGHPFHGNQYSAGSSGQDVMSHAVKVAEARMDGVANRADAIRMAQFHNQEAMNASNARNKAFAEGKDGKGEELDNLTQAHLRAAKTWNKVADYGNRNIVFDASKAIRQTQAALNHHANDYLNA